MKIMKPLSALFLALAAVATISLSLAGLGAGRFLVVDAPEPSDVLVVLAGDHNDLRYKRGLQFLADGYAPLMLADASSDTVAFGRTPVDLEQEFVQRTAGMLGDRIQVCPIRGVSTQDEARAIAKCLRNPLSKVLLVTSDYHSRRALSVLRREMPQYHWSVAAVTDKSEFQAQNWWRRREWAKTTVLEWSKLVWWQVVDRWRDH